MKLMMKEELIESGRSSKTKLKANGKTRMCLRQQKDGINGSQMHKFKIINMIFDDP